MCPFPYRPHRIKHEPPPKTPPGGQTTLSDRANNTEPDEETRNRPYKSTATESYASYTKLEILGLPVNSDVESWRHSNNNGGDGTIN